MEQSTKLDKKTLDALINVESAVFHVIADGGFNSDEDIQALKLAHIELKELIEAQRGRK